MLSRFSPLPVTGDVLRDYRIAARRTWRPAQLGAHITRRMGESQEFREHAFYQLGDDLRHVDWRASARMEGRLGLSGSQNWLIRRFSAEEHYNFVISLDTRDTMHFPIIANERLRRDMPTLEISKIQVARWIATALAWLALDGSDRVAVHPLFGQSGASIDIRGSLASVGIEAHLDTFTYEPASETNLNLRDLEDLLKPAAVWLILTDMYFSTELALRLADRMRAAVNGRRWLILVDLDSWPFEATLLGTGPRRIIGSTRDEKRLFITEQILGETRSRIEAHQRKFLSTAGEGIKISRWPWPVSQKLTTAEDLKAFFTTSFHNDRTLRLLFENDPWF